MAQYATASVSVGNLNCARPSRSGGVSCLRPIHAATPPCAIGFTLVAVPVPALRSTFFGQAFRICPIVTAQSRAPRESRAPCDSRAPRTVTFHVSATLEKQRRRTNKKLERELRERTDQSEETDPLIIVSPDDAAERDSRVQTRQPRVAFFVEPSPFSHVCGLTNRFLETVKHMRDAGDDVLMVTPEPETAAPLRDYLGASVHQVPGFEFIYYRTPNYRLSTAFRWGIFQRLREFKPDVLHVATPGFMVWGGIVASRVFRIPLVLSYHTHIPKYIPQYSFPWLVGPMWTLIRFWHGFAEKTLVTSKVMQAELTDMGVPRVHVWPHGIDTDRFHPRFKSRDWRVRLCGGEEFVDCPLVVYVGRLGAEKNVEMMQPVFEALATKGVRLAVVGSGPHRDAVTKALKGLPVVFTGMLRGDDLSSAYATADIKLMPSETETLGFVVLEAMASGVPVVAVRAGGIPTILKHEETGLFYEPGDVQGAAAAIDRLLADEPLRSSLGTAARKEAERWGWDKATEYLREMYSDIHEETNGSRQ